MKKSTILLVEDSEAQGEATKRFLQKNSYEVIWAKDGISAIREAKTKSFDVILLDLILPDISGNEISRILKFSEDTKGIPIIMVTARDSLEDRIASIDAGVDDYLAKPYNEVELISRIYAAARNKLIRDELIKQKKQVEDLLVKVGILAITDPLTGLFNRRHLEAELEKEFSKHKRHKHPVTCVMIDVDRFKRINDIYGHKTGDIVLREIARILQQSLRKVDIAARWGGEEFVVIMPQTDSKNALISASRILETVSRARFEQNPDVNVTVSIGIAIVSRTIATPEKLIDEADKALYQAKKKGRNRIEIAEEETSNHESDLS